MFLRQIIIDILPRIVIIRELDRIRIVNAVDDSEKKSCLARTRHNLDYKIN